MEEIKYNTENKEIQFAGRISSFKFYTQFFKALKEHYKENGNNKIPSFSFVYVDDFESPVLPNLISIGLLIKKMHGGLNPIPLNIINTYSTKFLDSAWFFENAGIEKEISEETIHNNFREYEIKKIGLEIFNFNIKQLGFYNYSNIQRSFNPKHKVRVFENQSDEYYKLYEDQSIPPELLEYTLETTRTKKFLELESKVNRYFQEIIYHYEHSDEQNTAILNTLTEIICNSVLYSKSLCTAMLQSFENKTLMSISDIGIGFEGSFKYKPKFEYYVSTNFQNPYKSKLKNYLLIFDALHYSKNKDRENLFTLLNIVLKHGGKMRIHYENVQVVFTSNRCRDCEIIPLKCAKCLLDNLSNDQIISPVRFFSNSFQGVHIEVELNF